MVWIGFFTHNHMILIQILLCSIIQNKTVTSRSLVKFCALGSFSTQNPKIASKIFLAKFLESIFGILESNNFWIPKIPNLNPGFADRKFSGRFLNSTSKVVLGLLVSIKSCLGWVPHRWHGKKLNFHGFDILLSIVFVKNVTIGVQNHVWIAFAACQSIGHPNEPQPWNFGGEIPCQQWELGGSLKIREFIPRCAQIWELKISCCSNFFLTGTIFL